MAAFVLFMHVQYSNALICTTQYIVLLGQEEHLVPWYKAILRHCVAGWLVGV